MKRGHPVSEGRRVAGRVFFGLCLAAAGALILLENLGRFPAGLDWRLWPLLLAFLAGARMVERGFLRIGPHLLAMLALVLLAGTFEREELVEQWWPVAIVWIGILTTLRALRPRPQPAPSPSVPDACDDPTERQP